MKFKLLLCISLLFSVLHAAAVPISDSAKMIGADSPLVDCMNFHCNSTVQDDQKTQQCCPGALALQPPSQLLEMISSTSNNHASFSSSLIRLSPDVLFRPPKFIHF